MHQLHVVYTHQPTLKLLGELLDQMPLPDQEAHIALKPNLVVAKPSSSGATTDPILVETVVSYLRDKGYRHLTIIEGSWIGASTAQAFRVCGYEEISRKYDVPLVDLKQDDSVAVDVGGMKVEVCQTALAADYLINLPVLKAHCQTKITCALKNLKGCIPDREKRRFHSMGLHKPIAALNHVLRSDLVIVDGMIGDLTFEEGGTPVCMGRVIVGVDPVAIDAYSAELLGYSANDIPYIQEAEKLGVGVAELSRWEVIEHNQVEKTEIGNLTARHVVDRYSRFIDERKACSACYGSLIHALTRFEERHGRLPSSLKIAIGQGFQVSCGDYVLGVGRCTANCENYVPGCPPSASKILDKLESIKLRG